MGHMQATQGSLELADGIGMIVAGTGPEQTQRIGIDAQGNAPLLEQTSEVFEVVPGRVRRDKASPKGQPGTVVHAQQQDLLGGGRPPLVDAAVVLPEFTHAGATKTPVYLSFAFRGRDQMGQVSLRIGFDA